MLKKVHFHGDVVDIEQLSNDYKITPKEIRFRYRHGCREDNLVIKHIYPESPYSFIKFKNKRITIKEFLSDYPYLNVLTVRKRYSQGKKLTAPLKP